MEQIRDFFNQGWVSVSFSVLFFVLSIGVGYIFYRLSLMGPRPVYQRQALRLIGQSSKDLPEEVVILYKDKLVPRLTKNYFIVWNTGVSKAEGKDIVQADPLRFEVGSKSEILKVSVIKVNNVFSNVSVEPTNEPNCWSMSFDYLNPGDGAVIELLHTDERLYVDLKGTIKGIRKGVVDLGEVSYSSGAGHWRKLVTALMSTVTATSALFMTINKSDKVVPVPAPAWLEPSTIALVVLAAGALAVEIVSGRRRYPKSLVTDSVRQ